MRSPPRAAFRRDDLRIDVPRRAVHASGAIAQPSSRSSSRVRLRRAAHTGAFLVAHCRPLALLLRLPCTTPRPRIDAFALVGLGRAEAADFAATCPTSCLSTPLTMISVWLGVSTDALRHGVLDRVRKAEGQVERPALGLRAIADALRARASLETLGHALEHVAHQRAQRAGIALAPCPASAARSQRAVASCSTPTAAGTLKVLRPSALHADAAARRRVDLRRPSGSESVSLQTRDIELTSGDVQTTSPPMPWRARLLIGHDAARGGHDRDAEAAHDLRQLALAR